MEQVVEMCTINPARALGEEGRLGSLGTGKQADISVLDIKEGDWVVYDVLRVARNVARAVVPVMAVKRGEVFEAGWGPRTWGWEPDPA
jgi:dihydroorotase